MKYALIGCGRIAYKHLEAALKESLEICALCDVELQKAEKLRQEYKLNNTSLYADYETMLQKEKPELVAIATPSHLHGIQSIKCMQYDCHLIVEKPLSLSTLECNTIVRYASEKNRVISVCHQNRLNVAALECKRIIQSGHIGKILYLTGCLHWNRGETYYSQAEWRGKWESDGGVLMNQGIHCLDMMLWLGGGNLQSVYGSVENLLHPTLETEDTSFSIGRLDNGVPIIVDTTSCVYRENLEECITIFGEQGILRLGGTSLNQLELSITAQHCGKNMISEQPTNVYGNGHTPLYGNTVSSISTGVQPFITAEDGKNAVEYVLAIYESARQGAKITLPQNALECRKFKGVFDFDPS